MGASNYKFHHQSNLSCILHNRITTTAAFRFFNRTKQKFASWLIQMFLEYVTSYEAPDDLQCYNVKHKNIFQEHFRFYLVATVFG